MDAFTVNPFDPIAKEYDQWFDDNKNAYLSELEALKLFLPAQGKGLEIGVGTGRFASQLGIECGIEPSEHMASLARQRGIEVVTAFGEQMPFPDCSFDFAIMVTVDCFVRDIRQVYREAFRIIRNGGVLIIGTLHKDGAIAKSYQTESGDEVYEKACFRTISDTMNLLKETGFYGFNTCQTLFSTNVTAVENPTTGNDKGSFVVIEALKPDKQ